MSGEPFPSHQLKWLQVVHELHRMGYQKLRVYPYFGPNYHWRCLLHPASNVDIEDHQRPINESDQLKYTEAAGYQYFDWANCEELTPYEIAFRVTQEKSEFLRDCQGSDPAYVQWYIELLGFAAAGVLPTFGGLSFSDYSNMGTLLGRVLPNPPLPDADVSGPDE